MVENLKKLDKKFLIIAGVIIVIPILLIIFLAIIQGCSNNKISYDKYENKLLLAGKKYFSDKKLLPNVESEVVKVDLDTLIKLDYIKSPSKSLDDSSCTGEVTVRLNGSVVEENDGGFYNYLVNLKCSLYETNNLNNNLLKSLTDSGSGLYKNDEEYIFRGDSVKNYIKLYNNDYRIIGITSTGLVKVIKSDSENLDRYWDIKYNTDVNDSYGKNIYQDSDMLKYLMNDYKNSKKISNNLKEKIVSHDVCIDSRDIKDVSINKSSCTNVLSHQVISLIGVEDYAKASLDSECVSIVSKSCRNYNYMKDMGLTTWTYVPVSNNTYEVYYLDGGLIRHEEASNYENYNLVFYIDVNEIISSGNGSLNNPYVIK